MSKLLLRKCNKPLLLILLLASTTQLLAQYSIASIDPKIKQNADAVFHKDELKFEVISKYETQVTQHIVVTVLNQNGRHYGVNKVNYTKGSQIKEFSAKLLDASGQEIDELKKAEFLDRSSISGFSLYEDNRVRIADFKQKTYPYTVEFYTVVEYNNTFYTPDWYVLPDENIGVVSSSFTITSPESLMPNYYPINTDLQPSTSLHEGIETVSWSFKNIAPFEFEPHNYELKYYSPIIYTAAQEFGYGGYEGNLSTWQSFGEWIIALNNGRDQLAEETITEIKELTRELNSREEKIKTVYEYLQSKTRYVSIQLGIGGYQPFEASIVDEYGYGDCKALTNFSKSLLKTIDIESYYTLIRAGKYADDIDADFATSAFNHVILAVPNENDTIWLECTSQSNPFGYLGTFTGNRNALLVKPGKSEIVRTPNYSLEDNVQERYAAVVIKNNGNAQSSIHTIYRGIQYENKGLNRIVNNAGADQKKWLYKNLDIGSFTLDSYEISEKKERIPQVELEVNAELNDFATLSGKRLFFKPNLMNRLTYVPKKIEQRKSPIIIKRSYRDIDSIHYMLPEGYHVEYMPEPIEITSEFGYYRMQLIQKGKDLVYVRERKIYQGKYDKEEYENFIEFYKGISKSDNERVVLVNKT